MRTRIIIADYCPRWPQLFEEERQAILSAIGEFVAAIEHVGSTAVPGLAAKPIIDIMAGLRSLDDALHCIERLAALNYEYVPEYEREIPERRYFRKGPPGARTHHLHMVEVGAPFWVRTLLFRDYLRAHPATAREYEQLKRELAARYSVDRAAYTDAKGPFVAAVEERGRSGRDGT